MLLDYLRRIGHRLANDNGVFDRDAVQAIASLAANLGLTDRILECLPGPTPIVARVISFPEDKKITAIKAVRTVANCGLKDSKEFVEGQGTMILSREKLDDLEAVGIVFEEIDSGSIS